MPAVVAEDHRHVVTVAALDNPAPVEGGDLAQIRSGIPKAGQATEVTILE
jgi:hypothetical protein